MLTLRTRENTGRLNTSTMLFHEREELEQKLDSKQKSLVRFAIRKWLISFTRIRTENSEYKIAICCKLSYRSV